jgi:hypothetical protein
MVEVTNLRCYFIGFFPLSASQLLEDSNYEQSKGWDATIPWHRREGWGRPKFALRIGRSLVERKFCEIEGPIPFARRCLGRPEIDVRLAP